MRDVVDSFQPLLLLECYQRHITYSKLGHLHFTAHFNQPFIQFINTPP